MSAAIQESYAELTKVRLTYRQIRRGDEVLDFSPGGVKYYTVLRVIRRESGGCIALCRIEKKRKIQKVMFSSAHMHWAYRELEESERIGIQLQANDKIVQDKWNSYLPALKLVRVEQRKSVDEFRIGYVLDEQGNEQAIHLFDHDVYMIHDVMSAENEKSSGIRKVIPVYPLSA